MQIENTTVDVADEDIEDGGAVVELDDDSPSPYDLEAERDHLETRYPDPEAGGDDAGSADQRGRDAVARRQQQRQEGNVEQGDGADTDDELVEGYGKRVSKRIKRETAKRRHAERGRDAAEQARQRAEHEAAHYKRQLESVVGMTIDDKVETMASQIEGKLDQLRQATEDGNVEAQVKLMDEVAELRSQLSLAKLRQPAARQPEDQGRATDTRTEEGGDQDRQQQRRPTPTPATQAWLRENEFWFFNPANEWARRLAIEVDHELAEKSGKPADEEHYKAVHRELLKRDPRMSEFIDPPEGDPDDGGDGDGGDPPAEEPKPRQNGKRRKVSGPVAPADGNGPGNPDGKSRVQLSKDDLVQMQGWGLDPSNPKHLKKFAQERLATKQDFDERGRR